MDICYGLIFIFVFKFCFYIFHFCISLPYIILYYISFPYFIVFPFIFLCISFLFFHISLMCFLSGFHQYFCSIFHSLVHFCVYFCIVFPYSIFLLCISLYFLSIYPYFISIFHFPYFCISGCGSCRRAKKSMNRINYSKFCKYDFGEYLLSIIYQQIHQQCISGPFVLDCP